MEKDTEKESKYLDELIWELKEIKDDVIFLSQLLVIVRAHKK